MQSNRLSKVLAAAGVASRRACEQLIFDGLVTVNGEVVLLPQTIVNLSKDKISVAGKAIKKIESKVYYLLNKPKGYLCTNAATGSSKIILDLFPDADHRLFTVGRLDRDTTGLIIVTNDGQFANKVIHPSSNIQKEYVAKTDQEITDVHLITLSKGVWLEGLHIKPVRVTKVRKGTVKVVVTEGKKREVRLLLEAAGLNALALKRTRIGSLILGLLPEGAWRELTSKERDLIFK